MDFNFLISIKNENDLSQEQKENLGTIVIRTIQNKTMLTESQLNILLYLLNKHKFYNYIIQLKTIFNFQENNLVHLISALSNNEKIDEALEELNKIKGTKNDHFRFYSPILSKLLNIDINKALTFFKSIKIQMSQEGICQVIYKLSENNNYVGLNECMNKLSLEFNELTSFELGKECKINCLGICNNCNNTLNQVDMSEEVRFKILNSLQNKCEYKEMTNTKFNLIVDGANVGFFENGGNLKKIELRKILKVIKLLDKNIYKPCVVLHKRHKKLVENFFNKDIPFNVIYTPFGKDDDLISLYLAIKNNCMLISNDQYKNHAYLLNEQKEFNKWYKCHVVNYNLQKLFFPSVFSSCTQKNNNIWHIPIENGNWKCYKIEQ